MRRRVPLVPPASLLTVALLGPVVLPARAAGTVPSPDVVERPSPELSSRTDSPVVALQPLGPVDPAVLATVATCIRAVLSTEVAILPARSLPGSAYYPPRHRYRGDDLLAFLDQATPAGYSRVIGITGKDISVTRGPVPDWGVFGVARLSGRPGLVSTFRLGAGAVPAPVVEARLEKVVVRRGRLSPVLTPPARRSAM